MLTGTPNGGRYSHDVPAVYSSCSGRVESVGHTAPGASQPLFNAAAVLFATSCILIVVCHISVPGDFMSFAAQPALSHCGRHRVLPRVS
jgi:hypothetical protein